MNSLEQYKKRFANLVENSNNIGKGAKFLNEQELPTDEPEPDVNASDTPTVPEVPANAEEPSGDLGGEIPSDTTTEPTDDMATDAGLDTNMGGESEGLDITELVNQIKHVEEKMDGLSNMHADFTGKVDTISRQISALEGGFAQFNALSAKLDGIAQRIETIREKTPEEKLEMRSLDSAPFSEKPKDFFNQKQNELQTVGKNYEFTPTMSNDDLKQSFKPDFN